MRNNSEYYKNIKTGFYKYLRIKYSGKNIKLMNWFGWMSKNS